MEKHHSARILTVHTLFSSRGCCSLLPPEAAVSVSSWGRYNCLFLVRRTRLDGSLCGTIIVLCIIAFVSKCSTPTVFFYEFTFTIQWNYVVCNHFCTPCVILFFRYIIVTVNKYIPTCKFWYITKCESCGKSFSFQFEETHPHNSCPN